MHTPMIEPVWVRWKNRQIEVSISRTKSKTPGCCNRWDHIFEVLLITIRVLHPNFCTLRPGGRRWMAPW